MPEVILRGAFGSAGNALGIFAVLAGAPVGSIAAFRSVNSIVASLGSLACDVSKNAMLGMPCDVCSEIFSHIFPEIMEIYGDRQIEAFKNGLRFSSDCQEQWLWESILDGCIFCPCFGGFMDVLLSDPWGGFLHIQYSCVEFCGA